MDHGFSIRMPDGSRFFVDVSGGETLSITVADKVHYFEFSDRFGPLFVSKTGKVLKRQNRQAALRAVSLWRLQGMRIEGVIAVWHEPRKEIYELRGRQVFVIQHGEPGWDW